MNILVVEDEAKVAAFVKQGLEESGYTVQVAFDGNMGLRLAASNKFDVIMMDVIMPGINGFEVLKKLRNELRIETPVLMLSALDQSSDIIEGLDLGADDYLTKPFKFGELLARLRALSRRKKSEITIPENIIRVSGVQMNLDSKEVQRSGKIISLTAKEFTLLEFFLKNKGRVMSRVQILENVWDINYDAGTNVVDVYVNYLRNKIDKNYDTKLIQTVVGMGYVLKEI
ncbi:MAG: response regulator transcription factor [Flavobacteriales bacterium]|nr:response regulator transcription factor [Flavobacteriales bacterium]